MAGLALGGIRAPWLAAHSPGWLYFAAAGRLYFAAQSPGRLYFAAAAGRLPGHLVSYHRMAHFGLFVVHHYCVQQLRVTITFANRLTESRFKMNSQNQFDEYFTSFSCEGKKQKNEIVCSGRVIGSKAGRYRVRF